MGFNSGFKGLMILGHRQSPHVTYFLLCKKFQKRQCFSSVKQIMNTKIYFFQYFMELWNTVVQGRSERKWNTISIFTGLEFSITASKLSAFNIKSQRAWNMFLKWQEIYIKTAQRISQA